MYELKDNAAINVLKSSHRLTESFWKLLILH